MPNTAKTLGKNDIKTLTETSLTTFFEWLDVSDDASYQKALERAEIISEFMSMNPEYPAMVSKMLDLLCEAIEKYEDTYYPIDDASPTDILRYLMDSNELKQSDLVDIFGSQGNLSQILKGSRNFTLEHIKKLAVRFNVSPLVFIDAYGLKDLAAGEYLETSQPAIFKKRR